MQSIYIDPKIVRRQQWEERWPTSILAIIAIIQMLLTFVIIGSETWNMILNTKYAFLFVGYNAAFFFTITWISTFTVVCCNQGSRACATHALVENILSVFASCVLLYYDARFLQEPWTCLWPGDICSDIDWDFFWTTWWNKYDNDTQTAKIIAIKVQLSCAAIMLVLSLVYIYIFIQTSIKVKGRLTAINPENIMELSSQQQFPPPPRSNWSMRPSVWYSSHL